MASCVPAGIFMIAVIHKGIIIPALGGKQPQLSDFAEGAAVGAVGITIWFMASNLL